MATVNSLVLALAQKIDPYTKEGVEIIDTTIDSAAGNSFTAAQRLQIYNDARVALMRAILNTQGPESTSLSVPGTIVNADISWSATVATRPTDMIAFVSMRDSANVPMTLLPASLMNEVESGKNPYLTSTATLAYVFEVGTQFLYLGSVSHAGTGKIRYVKLANWVTADVTKATTATETIDIRLHPQLLEIAQAISQEMGTVEVGALASKLIGGQ
jgi:hypothetical protein